MSHHTQVRHITHKSTTSHTIPPHHTQIRHITHKYATSHTNPPHHTQSTTSHTIPPHHTQIRHIAHKSSTSPTNPPHHPQIHQVSRRGFPWNTFIQEAISRIRGVATGPCKCKGLEFSQPRTPLVISPVKSHIFQYWDIFLFRKFINEFYRYRSYKKVK